MAVPTKAFTFSNTPPDTNVIDADEINENYDRIYDYLQDGVELLDNTSNEKLGLSAGATVRRGKSILTAEETVTTSATFASAPTPDRVSGIVLPTDGLIFLACQSMWQYISGGAPRAAIFLGGTECKMAYDGGTAPGIMEGQLGSSTAYVPLVSTGAGLISGNTGGSDYTGDLTTGQIIGLGPNASAGGSFENPALGAALPVMPVGGVCAIFAAAGSYDVGIRYKTAGAGSIKVKNRKLWVWTQSF